MRLACAVAAVSLSLLAALPGDAAAQDRDRDRDRDRREREERAEERRERLREARDRAGEREERAREERERAVRARTRERVQVRVYRERYRPAVPRRDLTLAVGVLNYDFAGTDDDNFPMAALRGSWRFTRLLHGELDATYAIGDVADPTATDGDRSTSLATTTAGVRAELPFRYLRPYAGVAVGLFGRFDGGDDGQSFVRPTTAVPLGVRLALSPRLGVRAEVRFRFDQHENNTTAVNREQTVGLSFGF